MSVPAVLAPVFSQALLLFVLLFWMGRMRLKAVRAKDVRPNEGSPRTYGWPRSAQLASDCYHNQFEIPVLFYGLVPLALFTHKADLLFVAMAWIFVASRYAHAFEHTGRNRLKVRFPLFAFGANVLLLMWLIFAARVLFAL